ncbi:MAG: spore germination protein, partial [Firmicutes bacterium]|nr:spore germination protein [Bacillota bacterium]
EQVIKPLFGASQDKGLANQLGEGGSQSKKDFANFVASRILLCGNVVVVQDIEMGIGAILGGHALVVFEDGVALDADVRLVQMRGVSESSENIIKGAKDCFVESFRVNTALIRAHYKSPSLVTKELQVGKSVSTTVVLAYCVTRADLGIVKEIEKKLQKFDKNGVFSSGDLEDHLSRHKNKIFPELTYSERPDKVAGNINEGKIAIIIDNLPFVYVVPATFSMMMQAVEDYSHNYIVASFTRVLRYFAFFLSVTLPGLYIAVMMYHHEMIPLGLAMSLIASKEGVAFPTPFEVFFMLIAFEILVEAGLRMPKAIGQAVSIVGALVVGQAAVSANFISASVIVIIALSAIAGFTTPDQDLGQAVKIWRLILCVLASILGLYGLVLGLIVMGSLMARMEFFEQSFMYPFANSGGKFLKKDTLIRNT